MPEHLENYAIFQNYEKMFNLHRLFSDLLGMDYKEFLEVTILKQLLLIRTGFIYDF